MGHVRENAYREHRGALSVCAALLAALLPCAAGAQPAHAGHAGHAEAARVPTAQVPTSLVSENGSFAITLEASPSPIRLNEPFELTVAARALAGDGRGVLSVTVDAQMPAHRHGMNTRPYREALREDRFLFRGMLFHMSGEWEIVIEAAQGSVRDRAIVRLVIE